MKYKVVLFDADETLFDFKKAENFALEESLKKLGIEGNKDYYIGEYKRINSQIWRELDEGKIELKVLKIERFNRYFKSIGVEYDPHEFANLYMENLGKGSFIYEGARELLNELNNKVTLAIITNGLSKVQDERIKKSEISHYFKEIIVSEAIGVSKPDPKIFEHTLERLNHTSKDDVIIIGDNLSSDIKGGINFGIDTCWYNPRGVEDQKEVGPTYEVKNYSELLEILRG